MTRKEIEQESFKVYPEKLGYSTIIEKTVDYNREKREIWIAGAEWADKTIIEKVKSLIKEWSLGNSAEAKYKVEAYKELIEIIEKEEKK